MPAEKVICFGDSLTFGSVGYSYCRFVNNYRIVNKGINGDTSVCALRRLETYLKKHGADGRFVISIGTNDLLIPHLASSSFGWRLIMGPRAVYKKCVIDDAVFAGVYERYFSLLDSYGASAVAVGIPVCELPDFSDDAAKRRNDIIKQAAERHGVPFVDAHALQLSCPSDKTHRYSWKAKQLVRLSDAFVMLFFPFLKDAFSRFRRLTCTVDGVHYNSFSARIIGENVAAALDSIPAHTK